MSTTRHPSVTTKTHPIKEGWLHISLELKPGVIPSAEDEERLLLMGGNPADYDIAIADRQGRKLKGATRRKATAEPDQVAA